MGSKEEKEEEEESRVVSPDTGHTTEMATTGTMGTDGFLRSGRKGGTMEDGFSQELQGTSSDQN